MKLNMVSRTTLLSLSFTLPACFVQYSMNLCSSLTTPSEGISSEMWSLHFSYVFFKFDYLLLELTTLEGCIEWENLKLDRYQIKIVLIYIGVLFTYCLILGGILPSKLNMEKHIHSWYKNSSIWLQTICR